MYNQKHYLKNGLKTDIKYKYHDIITEPPRKKHAKNVKKRVKTPQKRVKNRIKFSQKFPYGRFILPKLNTARLLEKFLFDIFGCGAGGG